MECFKTETDKTSVKCSYLRSIRRLREAASPSTLSPPDLSEPVRKDLSCGIKMGDNEKSKSRTSKFTNFEALLCIILWDLMCKLKFHFNFKKLRGDGSCTLCIAQLCTLSSVSCSFYLTQCFLLQGHIFAVGEAAHPWLLSRAQRDIPAASKSGSGAISFASSSSSAGSTSSSGSAPGYSGFSARSGSLDGAPGGLIACIV
jgi:hypothetical protein